MYYTREIASLCLAYGEVKVLRKVKFKKIMRKKERSLARGHKLENPSSLPSEKEDRSDPKIN